MNTQADFDCWLAEFKRQNGEFPRVDVVDFRNETPNTHLSTTFRCTSSLTGRLTPYPHYPHIYVLDFVSKGRRVDQGTNLRVYDVGVFGERKKPAEIRRFGGETDRREGIDLFFLDPGFKVKICDEHGKTLQFISFTSTNEGVKPRIE